MSWELPPLARGVPGANLHSAFAFRSTPAYARNTGGAGWLFYRAWNYPRLREEYARALPSSTVISELPPLARGIHFYCFSGFDPLGITPARAGNTARWCAAVLPGQNYPRLRGEYRLSGCNGIWPQELPPLARGIHFSFSSSFGLVWNYPRLRGEYIFQSIPRRGYSELPPLARGIPVHISPDFSYLGITPACAGNTIQEARPWCRGWNYPRLHGEYRYGMRGYWCAMELPPLARGIP